MSAAEVGDHCTVTSLTAASRGSSAERDPVSRCTQRIPDLGSVPHACCLRCDDAKPLKAPSEADAAELDNESTAITFSSVTVFPCAVTGSPPGTGEAPD